MQYSKTILGCGAVLFLASTNLLANCQGSANEVGDCSFEAIPIDTSWTMQPGDSFTRDTINFTGGVAAGRIDTEDFGGTFTASLISDCFLISESDPYGFGVFLQLVSGGSGPECLVSLRKHVAADCSDSASVTSTGFLPLTGANTQFEVLNDDTTGFDAAFLQISCRSTGADMEFVIDEAFAGPGLTPVELQQFSID